MNKNIEEFTIDFNAEKERLVALIKSKLISSWDKFHFDHVIRLIITDLNNKKVYDKIENPIYSELLENFDNRENIYLNNDLDIIPEILKSTFDNIENNELTFTEFVIQLALREANLEIKTLLNLNRELLLRVYLLKKLDGYQNMPEFEIVRYTCHSQNTSIYYEVDEFFKNKTLYREKTKNQPLKSKTKKDERICLPFYSKENINEIINENFFIIKEGYKYKISMFNFYKYLTDDFINDEKTSYLDFIKVFFLNPVYHRSNIHFHCTTQRACLFLNSLFEDIITNLNQSAIQESTAFLSLKGIGIRQDTFSKSIKNTHADYSKNILLVKDAIAYLENIPI